MKKMINLDFEFCQKIKEARRAAGLSQSEVARSVGCKQSALSMFELGGVTKINEDVVRKLAEKFHVSLEEKGEPSSENLEAHESLSLPHLTATVTRGFCPNPKCPSNHAYEIEGITRYLPDRNAADPVGGRYCALCGEILEKLCPNCGAPVHEGAICSLCGDAYIAAL